MEAEITALTGRFTITETVEKRPDLAFLTVPASEAVDLLTRLRDSAGYVHLAFFTCVDRIEEGQFELVYMLHNYEKSRDLGVKTRIPRAKPEMEGIHHLWEAAATYQRELYESYGISFPGSPRLTDPFALEGWDALPPMRRDFDTRKYSEETYYPRPGRSTTDPSERMREKLYPGRADL